jgi:predicted AAA+ superfamily ATPase
MRRIQAGTEEFGRAFEHFLIEEVRAYLSYSEKYLPMAFWRTSTGLEVDLIIGNLDLAIECKATTQVDERHTKGLQALQDDQRVKQAIVVSLDSTPRQLSGGITVYPWQVFCQKLWANEFAL